MIHKAKDLSHDQKTIIESLLGRQVLDEESISVRTFESPDISDQRRNQVVGELKQYFVEMDAKRELFRLPKLTTSSMKL